MLTVTKMNRNSHIYFEQMLKLKQLNSDDKSNSNIFWSWILTNSYMDSEDDMSNLSAQRDNSRHVHYADSSITSSNTESSEMDKYLDEAIENDEEDEMPSNRLPAKSSMVRTKFNDFFFELCYFLKKVFLNLLNKNHLSE